MNRIRTVVTMLLLLGLTATSAWADFKRERTLTFEPGGVFTLDSDIGEVVLTGGSASGSFPRAAESAGRAGAILH